MKNSTERTHALLFDIIRGAIVVSFSLLGSVGSAGVNELTPLGPEGGEITDVEFHRTAPNVVYMASKPGFYRSSDGGSSWQLIKPNFFRPEAVIADIAVDPLDSERVYIAAGDEVLVSQDGGLTFSAAFLLNRHGPLFRVECGSDGVVYVPDGDKMYRSQDRGRTWQQAGAFPQTRDYAHAVAVDPTNSNVVYVSLFSHGIFVSRDAGATWQLVSANAAMRETMHVKIDRTDPLRLWAATLSGVYRSDNGGADWTRTFDGYIYRVEIDPVNPQVVYAAPSPAGTLMRTTNGGANWSALPQHFGNSVIGGIAIHPTAPERAIAYSDGVWLSSDAGAHWTRGNTGFVATHIRRMVPALGTSGMYLATAQSGIHRLGSDNVIRAVDNAWLGALITPSNIAISDLVVTRAGATGSLDTLVTIFASNRLARSINGGSRWVSVAAPANTAMPMSIAMSPGSQSILYLGTTEGVFSSVDLGDTWTPRNGGLPTGTFVERLLSTSDPQVIYATGAPVIGGDTMTLFRTTDGAQTWAATALPAGFISGLDVHPSDPQTVYVGWDQSLLRTTDGGATWVQLNADVDRDSYNDVAFDPRNNGIVYASAFGRVMRSTDGGATWERLVVTPGPHAASTAVAADPSEENAVLVGSIGLGLRQLSIRPDLQLTMTAPTSMTANTRGTFTLQLQYQGTYQARNARVTMQLPASAINISATTAAGSCSVTAQQVMCTMGDLIANTTAAITVSAATSDTGPFSVQASATSSEADVNATNNSVSAQLTVSPAPSSSGGGGGGGTSSVLMLLALAGLRCAMRRASG